MKHLIEVMIVDDDSDDAGFLKDAFISQPVEVRFTEHLNGFLAMQHLFSIKAQAAPAGYPHVIFLDLHMPGQDGYQILKEIKSEAAFVHIPVIVLSSSMLKQDKDKCLAAGCDRFFTKPSSLQQYSETAEHVIHFLQDNGSLQPA